VDSQVLLAIAAAGVILALLALLVAVISIRNLRRLRADYAALVSGSEVLSAEQRFAQVLDRVAELGTSAQVAGSRLTALESAAPGALSRMGLIQFQAFEDVGGGQSSALALLDAMGSGVVITALHARVGTRIYVKRVIEGRGEGTLGAEESAAIAAALAQPAYSAPQR
jgi:phosphate/sulfate permease